MENSNQQTLNPLLSIWIKPRTTIQQIVDRGPNELVLILLVSITGLVQNIANGIIYNWSIVNIVFVNILITLATIAIFYLGSIVFLWTGSWLGGQGTYRSIRAAYAWANVPVALGIIIWAVVVLSVPGLAELWVAINQQTAEIPLATSIPQLAILVVLGLSIMAFGIWTLVVFVNSLAQVQGFSSAWKGLLNAILGGIIVFIPTLIIFIIVVFVVLANNPDLFNPNTVR